MNLIQLVKHLSEYPEQSDFKIGVTIDDETLHYDIKEIHSIYDIETGTYSVSVVGNNNE